MKNIYTLILFSIISIIISCSSDDETQIAIQFTIDEINNSRSFYWYKIEYNIYNYNTDILDSIKTLFNENAFKVVIYTSPGCGCGNLYAYFPQLIKVLDSVNITNYEIYVVFNADENKLMFEHPYSHLFQIATLPSIYLLKSEKFYYDIILQVSSKKISIEQALLDGIKFLE